LFTCFVDFQHAYDTVPAQLWEKLPALAVRTVQALYADAVRTADGGVSPIPAL
jgi:hypothetical protein